MNKNMIRGLIAAVIGLAVYHAIAFLIPFEKSAAFWIGYVFGLLAILLQIPAACYAFRQGSGVRSKFYGFPVARIAAVYLCVQLVLSILAMALGQWIPGWIPAVLFILILGAAGLGFIGTDAMRSEIQRQDGKIRADVSKMKAIRSLAASLPARCEDPSLRRAVEKFSEELRYSDPVSSEALVNVETELEGLTEELQKAILDRDISGAGGLVKQAEAVLAERNRLCKLNK